MNRVNAIKGLIASTIGVLNSFLGILTMPVMLLVFCNVIDYITGVLASKFRGQQISSYKGIRGIAKKIAMWVLIIVGAIIDILMKYSVEQLGIVCPFQLMIAAVVAVWLVCNELISILENLKDMEVPMPDFLIRLTQNVKSQIEEKVEIINEMEEKR